jgi:SRSO17 transposase
MVGQLRQLERQSIEPMALEVEGGTIRGMQRFISDGRWDEEQRRWHAHQLVADALGKPDGVLRCDETGFVKKGQDAVGVARQSWGTLGKGEHGQGGVLAGDASRPGDALVDKRFFGPEGWCSETSATRRTTCKVPQELTLQSKPQVAAAMLHALTQEGLLPFKSVVADCLYGPSPDFLDAGEACVGVTTFVAIPAETRCGLQRPQTEDKTSLSKGEVPAKRVVLAPANVLCPVAALAARLPASRWSRRRGSEGTKGPLVDALARQRVTLCKDGVPERTVWLVIKRTVGAQPISSSYSSHAPARTP